MQIGGTLLFWRMKRCVDIVLSCALLPVLGLFVFALICLNPWLNPGPLMYRQNRVGQHDRIFTMLKFRTMQRSDGSPRFADAEAHRIGWFGHILRRYRIDELPQVFNVLRGQMSLIGPRPEQPAFVEDYNLNLPDYPQRHVVRPGVSGLSQVVQGYTSDTDATRDKLRLDLRYIRQAGFRMELYVLWRTLVTVMTGFGAR